MKRLKYYLSAVILQMFVMFLSGSAYCNEFLMRQMLATPPKMQKLIDLGLNAQLNVEPATAQELAIAMDIPQANIISASLGNSDPGSAGVNAGQLGVIFPTQGESFAILSTGLASTASAPNDSGSTSTELNGLNNSQGNDLTQFTIELSVPAGATCLSFDFAFYSEEFPEYVGSSFNDAFTAEYGGTDLSIINNQVVAPLNFAFDSADNVISVNTVFGVTADTVTTYDGATPMIKARSPIDPGASTVKIVFSIQDLGDSVYDSAVFLDNFSWGFGVNCVSGSDADTDGDGLLNEWETNGVDVDGDGTIDVDLPAMGANPNHKDIFVEVDYMVDPATCILGVCLGGHTHKPKAEAIQAIINSFANAPVSNPDGTNGITLHVDSGADSIMNPATNATWGGLSRSEALAHADNLGTSSNNQYNWTEFAQIRQDHFPVARRDVFHYCIFAHNLGGLGGTSGISRGIPESDFIVSLGSWTASVGTINEQAGTLMHELGHNLGLKHGGDVHSPNYKPNFLSIMNYSFQTRGLRIDGKDGNFDYSRFDLPDLNESSLDETVGLNGGASVNSYGTRYYCGTTEHIISNVNNPIDWNCNGISNDTSVSADINKSGNATVLTSNNDWTSVVFNGGAVGQLGEPADRPLETTSEDITKSEDEKLIKIYGVSISGPGLSSLGSGSTASYSFKIKNTGESDDSYFITAKSTQNWANITNLANNINLKSGEEASFDITVSLPQGAKLNDQDILSLCATSSSNQKILDSIEVITICASTSATTTTTVSATTTTVPPSTPVTNIDDEKKKCVAKQVLGEGNPQIEILRDFRDSRLAGSAIGRRIIKMYYSNAAGINAAIESNPALQAMARTVFEAAATVLENKKR